MAAPVDAGRVTTDGSTSTTSHTLNLPGSIAAGNLLFVHLRSPGATTFSIAGFTELRDASPDGADDSLYVGYKIADGTEGATITVTLGTAQRMSGIAWRITGTTLLVQDISGTTGTSSQPNPPNSVLSPADPHDILWITLASGDTTRTLTNPPSGYSNGTISAHTGGDGGAGSCFVAGATLQATGDTSEDAGAWTLDGNPSNWSAYTFPILELGPARISQLPSEVLVQSDAPKGRVSQLPTEVLAQPDAPKGRTSQLPVEALVRPEPPIRISQLPVEVLVLSDNPAGRLSQLAVEVLHRQLYEDIYIAVID